MRQAGLTGRDLRMAILFGALVYLGIRFIGQIVDIILVFSIIGLFATTLDPVASRLEKLRIPRGVSAGVLAILVLSSFGLVLYLIIPPIEKQIVEVAKDIPKYANRIDPWLRQLGRENGSLAAYLPKTPKDASAAIQQLGASILGGASKVGASAATVVAGAFLIFICTIYSVANPKPLTEGFLKAFGPTYREQAMASGQRLASQVQAWAKGILIAMVAIFAATWLALSIIGLKQAFLFAVVAGFLEAVPIIGPVLSAVPPLVVCLMGGQYVAAVWVVLAFVAIQQFENHLLVPLIMSRQLSLHPVTVIFAVLVMGGIFGIVGVFLATPAAAAVGIIYDELYLKSLNRDAPGETDAHQHTKD